MMGAYYNEIEPFAVHVLKQLIRDGVIADGDVDTRSIADVRPEDLAGYTQCHFFAGGGLWSVAARLAGWPDDRPLWTGSCPCQPFSVAGKGAGTDDPRHLWPHFFRLVHSCRPAVVMGEQVAGAAGYNWFDGVRSDLEGEGYASRAVDIPACSVNAPHIRQRLYWVAQDMGVADSAGWFARQQTAASVGYGDTSVAGSGECDMANAESIGRGGRPHDEDEGRREQSFADTRARGGDMADTDDAGRQGRTILPERAGECSAWSDGVEWRRGADGKTRRVKSDIRLLVDGMPGRVGLLRIGGNAIVAPLAAEVIRAFMESEYRGFQAVSPVCQ